MESIVGDWGGRGQYVAFAGHGDSKVAHPYLPQAVAAPPKRFVNKPAGGSIPDKPSQAPKQRD